MAKTTFTKIDSFEKPKSLPIQKDKSVILDELSESKASYLIEKNNAEILDYLDKHLDLTRKDYNQKLEKLSKEFKQVKVICLVLIISAFILGVIIHG